MKLTKCFLQAASSAEESDESLTSLQQTQRKTAASKTAPTTRRPSDAAHKKSARSASSESSTSTESSGGSSSAVRSTGAAYTTEEVKQKILARGSIDGTPDTAVARSRVSSTGSKDTPVQKPFQSRFLNKSTPTPPPPKEDDTESTTEEETETEEESDDNAADSKEMAKSDIGPLLARSAQARDNSSDSPKRETSSYTRSRYGTPKEESPLSKYSRSRTATAVPDEEPSRYGYTSRFLNKSKSSAAVPPEEEEHSRYGSSALADDDSKYPSGRSRYMALKERRQRLARSRSSHTFPDDDDVDEPISPTSSNPSAYLASKGYGSATSSGNDLARSRSTHALKSRENSPDRSAGAEKDGAALSSWARYLKSKYGNRSGAKDKDSASASAAPSSSSSSATARRLSLGLPLRSSTELGSSDDDQKNMHGSPTTPTAATAAAGKFHHFFQIVINIQHFYWYNTANTQGFVVFPEVQNYLQTKSLIQLYS